MECVYCKALIERPFVCKKCKDELSTQKADNHQKRTAISQKIYSCYYYDDMVKSIIISYKYKANSSLYIYLAKEITKMIKENNIQADIITYVPLHKRKKSQRGFDQSARLAMGISYLSGIPFKKTLIRKKYTQQQAMLDTKMREQNVKNAFTLKIDKKLSKKSVIIIDDIVTTGSTLNACIKMLVQSDAKIIIPITFASTKFK